MTSTARAAPGEDIPDTPSMFRNETIKFLEQLGVLQLKITPEMLDEWPSHTPLIYVFQDSIPLSRFLPLNPLLRPSLARVDNPKAVRPSGFILNEGQIDYYSINPRTHKITLVKQSNRAGAQYEAGLPYLFETCDRLFPKGPPVPPKS